jgi:hypothetical protein
VNAHGGVDMNSGKVAISGRALTQRIDRALSKTGKRLIKTRTDKDKSQYGDYYVVDTEMNCVVSCQINLEGLGRETGALKAYECLEGE